MNRPRTTLKAVNAALAAAGHAERLVKGRGYWYFIDGDADGWYSASVPVFHLSAYTPEQWVARRDELSNDWRNR